MEFYFLKIKFFNWFSNNISSTRGAKYSLARKNLSNNKSHKHTKKAKNNPKYHPKSKNSFKGRGDDYGNSNFLDSEAFISEFNREFYDDEPVVIPERGISYEEKIRLEKQKLLYQKQKMMEKERDKAKNKTINPKILKKLVTDL